LFLFDDWGTQFVRVVCMKSEQQCEYFFVDGFGQKLAVNGQLLRAPKHGQKSLELLDMIGMR
jgi:hypothetical protein